MRKAILLAIVLIAIPLASASVVINQVLYNPQNTESGGEAVELYNNGDDYEDISGWKIATEASMSDAVIPDNTLLCPGCHYLVADKGWNESKDNETWADADHEELISLYNTDSGTALMDGDDVIDAVGWGDEDSIKEGLFEGTPAGNIEEGKSLLRMNDTDDNSNDFTESYPFFRSSSGSFSAEAGIEFEIANDSPNNPVVEINITPSHVGFGKISTGEDYISEIRIMNIGNTAVDIGVKSNGFNSNEDSIGPSTIYYSFEGNYKPLTSSITVEDINLEEDSEIVLKLKLNAPSNSSTGKYAGKVEITAVISKN